MHVEAVSEGEKGGSDDDKGDVSPPEVTVDPPMEVETEVEVEATMEEGGRTISPGPVTRSKRRSRSRSRSRGSKDLKGKFRGAQSPTPSTFLTGDSSQDDEPITRSPINLAEVVAPLLSPIPSHFVELQRSRLLLRSPTPMSPEPSLFYPGSPSSPLLPSLEALQRGLIRSNSTSNSTAGRMMAMHKLTGGTEVYDPSSSPTPPPLPGKLSRNNTVSGGERVAARQFMLSRLGGRFTKDPDGDQVSGGDDISAPSPTPKRRRRRSHRRSASANTGISDPEFLSTSPNTPVPPATPLPTMFDNLAELRAESTTPYGAANLPNQNFEQVSESSPLENTIIDVVENGKSEHPRRRSVVVEEDDEERYPPIRVYASSTLQRNPAHISLPLAHASDALSSGSADSASPSAISVPVYMSQRTGTGSFPSSPFTTPLKEVSTRDDDEEQVVYHADSYRPRTPYNESFDREISWIADPVPVHIGVNDEDVAQEREREREREMAQEEEEEEQSFEDPPLSRRSSNEFSQGRGVYDDTSPRVSSDSKSLIVESETSQDIVPSYPLSPSSLSQLASVTPASDDSTSFQTYPTRLSVASRSGDWDDRITNADVSPKRNGELLSTWEKMSTFIRTGSTSGRRSRTNSIRERRDHTDSSISRESGASLTSAKVDKGEPTTLPAQQPTPQPLMQSPSASASIVSLAPHAQRGGASPIPPASTADLAKYQDAKLFPFPGMIQLEEKRNRAKGLPSASASSPDIVMVAGGNDEESILPSPTSPGHTPEMTRERKLSHQASDTRLIAKYNPYGSSPQQPDYHTTTSQPSTQNGGPLNLKLPMTLPGVKQWLSKNNKKKFSSPPFSPPSVPSSSPAVEVRPLQSVKNKASLSDLLRRKDGDLGTDWEEINGTPTSPSGDTLLGKQNSESGALVRDVNETTVAHSEHTDTEKTPKAKKVVPLADHNIQPYDQSLSPLPRPDPLSPTPDPSSSLSDYPAHSTSESSSTTSSQYSLRRVGPQGAAVLERLDENLAQGSRSAIWAFAIDDPTRKLLLSSPVVQVVNANHVKDRFLLLFNDILIIAKPIIPDQDAFAEPLKPSPLDRKFIVKSVVMLHQLRFHADRTDQPIKSSPRNAAIKSFVHHFAKDPDHAVSSLLSKSGTMDDPVALGQLLFRTLDLDRARLGEYLSKRSSKAVLKAYLDSFGFFGLRIDRALRVFLHSMAMPTRAAHHLEYFLDAFAGRWYDSNSGIVEYDKDTAHRLVRAVVQLNDLLHDGIAHEPGPIGYPQREVTSRDFVEAFRRYDPRCLVSDELLEDIYESILRERLSQSRSPTPSSVADIIIVVKRPIPARLTWKMQSEPIVLRIPHADPHLSVRLYGQDLVFDPPLLNFGKSPEASFRVTGTSLGSKSIVMRRSGPNALSYTGLPLSTTVMVERAFMRHTFQMAFLNHNGIKRRYMFSVDDPLIRHQWALSLRRHVDQASASFASSSSGSSKFQRAADRLAFMALQETLIGSPPTHIPPVSQRLNDSSHFGHNAGHRFAADRSHSGIQNPSHVRSKSRSKLYHRHGAGKNEPDLPYGSAERDENLSSDDHDFQPRSEGPLWTARELEMHCLRNSSIASVLSYLQITTLENGERTNS